MEDCKIIIFRENINNPGMARVVEEEVRKWWEINKNTISDVHSIFGIERDENSPSKIRRNITIHYRGEAGINPVECKHKSYFDKIIKPGTCDIDNIHGRFCSQCKILLSTYTSKPDIKHTGDFISNNDATCLEDGTKTGTCIVCGTLATVVDEGSALGHNHVWETHIPETCSNNREEIGICSRCNDTIYRTIPNTKLNHSYLWSTDIPETCTNDRIEIGVCSQCRDTVRRTVINSALGHSYPDEWTIRVPATCLSDGLQFKKCIRCDNEITQVIPKLGHDYPDIWSTKIPATCITGGIEFKKCSRCDSELTRNIPIINHQWVNNNDGTHKCVVNGGCEASETCSPNDYGDTCSKCGYVTPNIELAITTGYINGMIIDTPFNQTLKCNAPGDVKWHIASGSLPLGISMNINGVISGTPTSSGLYTFVVRCIWRNQEVTKKYSINIAARLVTITFNANDGIISETTRQIAEGSTIGELPTATKDGYKFGGWFTADVGGMKVDENYSVSSDITLYARWGQGTDLEFSDATSTFNIQYNGDRTNYKNQPYTFYSRYHSGAESDLIIQTAISSNGNSSDMSAENAIVKLYMKVTNNGNAGTFDIGFDCDSYVEGDDCLYITRIEDGVNLNDYFKVTVPYETSIWVGKYNQRVDNRYTDLAVGTRVGKPGDRAGGSNDTGYAFTMNNIFINSGSYTILEVSFTKLS